MKNDLLHRVCIISSGRPESVQTYKKMGLQDATWFVKPSDERSYRMYGAQSVETSGGLCESRNAALSNCVKDGLICVQLSDDLSKVQWYDGQGKAKNLSLPEAIQQLTSGLLASGSLLAGVAPTSNTFYYTKPTHERAFIIGDFMAIHPKAGSLNLKFDENLKLKEDYDYTLQHLRSVGKVYRDNRILASFAHRTNRGGAVDFRTREREQEAIAYLKKKWGSMIRDNPRRPDEILLNLK